MTNEEIKKKYKIEPIMKEMWVWDNHAEDACLLLVIYKRPGCDYPYQCIDKVGYKDFFKYASETNPNEPQEPQVGDMGYFWDFQKAYAYGAILKIYENHRYKYAACTNSFFINFSKEKQPWMK